MIAERSDVSDKILKAFANLVAERGIEATTTRLLAETAGVNEITIFRKFGDKANLIKEFFQRTAPTTQINNYSLAFEANDPQQVATALLECICFLRDNLRQHSALFEIGLTEFWHFPELAEDFAVTPHAALNLLKKAFQQAKPSLRAEVDTNVAAFTLLSLMLTSVLWYSRGWLQLTEEGWDATFQAAIQPLINFKEA
jgi:AcrR family transcriptional regulator